MLARVFKLISGHSIASIIPLLATPLLTRLYSPTEFGLAEIYIILTVLFSLFMTLKLDAALVIPKDESQLAKILTAIFTNSLLTASVFFFITTISVLVFNLEFYYLLLPLSILLVGLYETCILLNLRERRYGLMSLARMTFLGGIAGMKIGFGYLGFSELGIILGTLLGQAIGLLFIFLRTRRKKAFQFKFNLNDWKEVIFHEYSDFPKHTLPQALFSNGREYLVSLVFGSLFGASILGFYTLALKVMRAPLYLLGNAFSDVAYDHYAKISSLEEAKKFEKILITCFGTLSIPYFVIFYFFSDISNIIFGSGWEEVGQFALYLSPWFYFSFVCVTFEKLAMVLRQQVIVLKINLYLDGLSILAFTFVSWYYNELTYSLITISTLGSIARMTVIVRVFKMLKANLKNLQSIKS